MSYLDPKALPLPFCPGCGHARIVEYLDQALTRLAIDPHRLVIVTDIGCVGIADKPFVTNAFHGLHGRAITYATGIKLARPDLRVVVLIGDGGCGIGGAHLLSAARRNVGVAVLVFNNFNFGMTGGEHSVTTPHGARTSTTFAGNLEEPLDICATVAAAKAGFVARTTVYDREAPDLIAAAIQHDGFAVVDIWDLCTAYYVQQNRMSPGAMREIMAQNGIATGILRHAPREEYSAAYRRVYQRTDLPGLRRVRLPVRFAHRVERRTGLILAGSAGEKIRSAATAFGRATILAGLWATQKDDYPITVMTGHSVSEVLFAPGPIDYTAIEAPDAALLVSEEGLRVVKPLLARMGENGLILAEKELPLPKVPSRTIRLPFARAAASAGKGTLGMVALAAYLAEAQPFPPEALEEAVRLSYGAAAAQANLRAVAAGTRLARG